MRNSRRGMMANRRVFWQAEDGNLLTDVGWYTFDSLPAEDGVLEEKNGRMARKYVLPVHGCFYRFFLPDTLCSCAAFEVEITIAGSGGSSNRYPILSMWLAGENNFASTNTMSFNTRIIAAYTPEVQGLAQHNLGIAQGGRYTLRTERRGNEAWTVTENAGTWRHGALPANDDRERVIADYPAGAPNESCILLNRPLTDHILTIWLHSVLWEEI